MKLSKQVLYYGKDEPLPEQIELRAGPLSLVYEAGDLRYIRLGRHEILRRIYVAVRDPNWGTVLPKLSNIQMDIKADSFRISYDVENKQGDIDFFWRGAISGDTAGTISFSMEGEARSTFRRNRIGFCVLHPMECAGAPARIEHVDGSVEENNFPQHIGQQLIVDGIVKPVHPFEEMQALVHQVVPGLWAEVRFSGDIFELEDQRNWTDASYKTYGTPLRLPFPVEVKAGTKIFQSVTLTLQGQLPAASSDADASGLSFSIGSSSGRPFPRLGLGVASHNQPLSQKELTRLRALNLSHLRIGLRLSEPDNEAQLRQAAGEAAALGVTLEVALFLSDTAEAELKHLADILERVKPPVWAWLIFHDKEKSTSEKWINLAREQLGHYDPAAKMGAGTNAFFAELNRSRPPVQALDLVCYSINPQVHAFDNLSLVETLAAQASTVESACQFCGDRLLAVTPVTLKMRFNPNATGPEPEPGPGELPSHVDERQMSLFGAAWTAGSLKYLAESDAQSLTYYETTGWRGVMETEAGSPIPDKFPSLPGAVFPLYHVLADVGELAGGEVLPTRSSQPLQVDGLALRQENRLRVVLANLSPEPQQVLVQNLGQQVRVRTLDETNAEEAMQNPEAFRAQAGELVPTSAGTLSLRLRPYAIARLEEVS
jgi:hypothetical protein